MSDGGVVRGEALTLGSGEVVFGVLALRDPRMRVLYDHGLCVTMAADDPRWVRDSELMELEDSEEAAAELWKTLCSDCPVWRECLDFAVETRQYGVWSGTTESRRRKIRRSKEEMKVGAS